MALTKFHIIDSISDQCGITKTRATELFENFLEIIKSTLESGEDILISRFGKFSVKEKSKRRGRNPATGDDLMLGTRRVMTFRCSPRLRDKING